MKKTLIAAIVVAAAAATALILKFPPTNGPKMYLYTWSDYFDPELIEEFETKFGCKVVIDTFDSNEAALAKLSSGANGYDLITPTSYVIPAMVRQNIIQKFDKSLVTNVLENFDVKFSALLGDSTNFTYSVPYAFSFTAIMYRKEPVKEGVDIGKIGWASLIDPMFKGRTSMMDDPREVLGAALKTLGFSVNTTNLDELAKAKVLAKSWKDGVAKMDNEMYRSGIPGGELLAAMSYNSDALMVMQENDHVGYAIPECGMAASFDEFCLSATSKRPDLAHAFVDFMYQPKNAARNVAYVLAAMPVKGVERLTPADMAGRDLVFPDKKLLSKCELIQELPPETFEEYNKAWDFVLKSSK